MPGQTSRSLTVSPTLTTPNQTTTATTTSTPTANSTGTVPPATTLVPTNADGTRVSQTAAGNIAPVQQAGVGGLMGMDANGDGVLTRTEFLAPYERQYDAMNKNTIGSVDLRRLAEAGEGQ